MTDCGVTAAIGNSPLAAFAVLLCALVAVVVVAVIESRGE